MPKATRRIVTRNAAKALLRILDQLGFQCALQGELACGMYGASRVAKAVEVLLFSPSGNFPDVDALKTGIALKSNGPSHFFIANSGAPQSVSRIICYRDGTIPEMKGMKTCDVHITYFHNAPLGLLRDIDGLPVAPLPFLLLRRLQKWDASLSFTKAGKIRAGVRDIQDLLGMLEKHQFEGTHFDPKLFELSKDCVREYRTVFSEHGNVWKKLGYDDVPPLVSVPSPEAAVSSQVEPNEPIETTEYLDYKSLSRIQMVCLAGKKSVDVLKKLDCASAIFGSLACFLYGNCRSPNDVDILVLPPHHLAVSTEDLKSAIVELEPAHFFLIPARDPQATYRLLYFRLTDGPGGLTPRTSCKIDIVVPGTLHLPALPVDLINWDEGLPLIPFPLLLLQKLQSWDDHRRSADMLKQLKHKTDIEDLQSLLELSEVVPLQSSRLWSDRRMFSVEFEMSSRIRVVNYCFLFQDHAEGWSRLGFQT